jgi:hypothetical protein
MSTVCNTSLINTPSFSLDQHCSASHILLVGTWRSKNHKIQGRGFALHFFGGGGLRRLVNASHSSFCISASLFELKLNLASERVSCLCFERERGFALYFFRGGGLRRLINVSHSSFCISASHFELKLDLARERESFMLVF